jgi:hypothetical protein
MKFNQWTLGLAAVGMVSLASVVQAEEAKTSSVATALSSTILSGYVDTSAQWNFGTGNLNNPKYAFNTPNKADGFNLNVVKLTLEKPADAAEAWGAGYKVDLLFGPDANFLNTVSTGVGSTLGSDFAVKQAYVDLKAPIGNGLDVKLGVFDTVVGYEVFESGNNPNFTRSYGYTIEPTTHTGVLLSYQITDFLGVSGGIANTFGPVINSRAFPTANPFASGTQAESYKTYMGSLSLVAPKDWGWIAGSTLYGGVINGFNSGSVRGIPADQTSFYAGSTLSTPIQALKVGVAYDYAGVSKQPLTATPGGQVSGFANAVGVYATYQLTEKMSINGRGEWFTQSKAQAVTGLPSKVFALTGTLQYDLWKNVISRVEARWDHQADGTGRAYGQSSATDPLGASRRNAYELIANLVYKF